MRDANAIATALLRISMGLMFLGHVYLRLTVITWPVAVSFFESIGLPAFMAYAVTLTEAIIGVLLVIGWKVRFAALVGAVILAGATLLGRHPATADQACSNRAAGPDGRAHQCP